MFSDGILFFILFCAQVVLIAWLLEKWITLANSKKNITKNGGTRIRKKRKPRPSDNEPRL